MPRNTQNPVPNKKNGRRLPGNGNIVPTTGINQNGPELSPMNRYEQEFDDFDLFQTKKPTTLPMSSGKKITTPGATGNTPLTSQENFNMTNIIKNKQVAKPGAKTIMQTSNTRYAVNFNIFYETKFGEEVWVLGSLKELGQWKEYKHKLFWGENHCWGTTEPIMVNAPYFEYKYALFGVNGSLEFWEIGINRIADLETLPCDEKKDATGAKNIFITDVWEEYKLRFTLFDPLYERGDQMVMCPSKESGLNTTYTMERIEGPEEWLISKYGKSVPLWECEVPLQNANGDGEGQFLDDMKIAFTYTYAKKKRAGAQMVKEREPARRFIIDNPNTYRGELADPSISSTPHFKISDSVKIVNGVVEKADGTFLYDFFFNEIVEDGKRHNIVVGPCPQSTADVKKMVNEGKVTAVLSLQTEVEQDQRAIETQKLKSMYRDQGIKSFINLPVEDNNLEDYSEDNYEACKALDQLLEQKQRVYVHCTAGMSRAQTIVTTYLSLYQKSKFWFNSSKVEENVRQCCNGCEPNNQCIQRTIQKYQHLFNKPPKMKKMVDEVEKRRLDIIAQREEKLLWERREIYLRAERDRTNRIKDQENEMIKQRRKLEEYERQKLIKFYYDKEMKLSSELKNLNIEEEEMIRRIKQQQIDETTQYEHYIQCHTEYAGVSDAEIDEQCQQLFQKAPIKFIPRKDIKLEMYLKRMIDEHSITIPIVHISKSLYLVGINKIHLEQKADNVIAQVGGGYQQFEPYIFKNHKIIEKQLIIKMIQSKESLEWIVDAIIRGEKIPTSHQTAYDSATRITGSPSVSRIQLLKVPSSRLDKNGLIRSDVVQTRRTTMIGSSQSPTRMGLSPTRLDQYTSPIAKKSSMASPTSKNSQRRTTASGQKFGESPHRGSKQGGYNSPKSKQGERSFSPTPQTKKLIKQIETKYDGKRQVVIKQVTSAEVSKNEHYHAKDQTIAEYNKGKYAYIHTEKSRAV